MIAATAQSDSVDIFALHGFATSAAIWQPLAAQVAPPGRLRAVNFPGHGGTPPSSSATTVAGLATACVAALSEPAIWLGWSLGGLVALHAARRYPQMVRGVVAVAISPRFLSADDWPNALDEDELAKFEALLKRDSAKALERFYALQTHTRKGPSARLSRELRTLAASGGVPPQNVLEETLSLLRSADLRDEAATLACPVMTVLGEDDALVPSAVCEDLVRLNPAWRVEVIEAAGHVPFLSHPMAFLRLLESFVTEVNATRGAA